MKNNIDYDLEKHLRFLKKTFKFVIKSLGIIFGLGFFALVAKYIYLVYLNS